MISALMRLDEEGYLRKIEKKLCIGQGFKGKGIDGIGIGSCTKNFDISISGCPPKSTEIVQFIKSKI